MNTSKHRCVQVVAVQWRWRWRSAVTNMAVAGAADRLRLHRMCLRSVVMAVAVLVGVPVVAVALVAAVAEHLRQASINLYVNQYVLIYINTYGPYNDGVGGGDSRMWWACWQGAVMAVGVWMQPVGGGADATACTAGACEAW